MAHEAFLVHQQWLALIAFVTVGAAPGYALADVEPESSAGHGLSISFDGPPACGPRDGLLRRTSQLLEYSESQHRESTPPIAVEASVARLGSGEYVLSLRLTGAVEGERRLRTNTCDEALRAGAVVIALAIDPEALSKQLDAETQSRAEAVDKAPASDVEPKTTRDFDVADRSPVDSRPPTPLNTRRFVGAAGSFTYGTIPEPHLGGMLNLAYEIEWLRLGAYGYFDPKTQHDTGVAGPVELGAYGGGGQLCARVAHWPRVDLHGCGGVRVSRISVSAVELEGAEAQRAIQVALIAEALASFHVASPLSLVLSAGFGIPTTRPRFVVDAGNGERRSILQPKPGLVAAAGVQFEL